MADDKKDKKAADEQKEVTPEEAATKGKKKKLVLIGAIAGVLALGGGGGAFFFLSGGEKKTETGEEMAAADGAASEEEAKEAEEPAKAEAKEVEKKPDAAGKEEGEKASVQEGASDFGETFALKTFHLNLGNPLENNYVRIEVTLEYTGGAEQKSEIERRMPQLRDAVVSIVSRKTREFLLSPDGKQQLRKEIFTRINRYMSKPVKAVFITDLLIE